MIRPLSNKVLVLPDPIATVTEGGIILTEGVNADKPRTGTVKYAGSGTVHISESGDKWCRVPLEVKEGDRVMYPPMDFPMIADGEDELAMMTEDNILAII